MNDLPERQDAAAAGDVAPGTFAFDPAGLPGDGLTFAILSQPSEGWAINNHDGSFFFDPVMDFRNLAVGESRRVKFTYQASDGQGATQTATITLLVTGRSDAPPMVELSGVVAGDTVESAPPAPPREPGFITDSPEDMAAPEENLPEAAAGPADDLGAIELVDIEQPVASAPEMPHDQAPDAWSGGMAVEEQQRRVEDSLAEELPEPGLETAAFDAPAPMTQDLADEPPAHEPIFDSPTGSDMAFDETAAPEPETPSGLAEGFMDNPAPVEPVADELETAPSSEPLFGQSHDVATDSAADSEPEPEFAQPTADLSASDTPAPLETLDSPDPTGLDGYQSDQLPLSPAGEAAMEAMAAVPLHHEPTSAPENPVGNAFDHMADAEPMTAFGAEPASRMDAEQVATPDIEQPAPLAMDVAEPDMPEADPLAVGVAEPDMPDAAPLTMDAAEPDMLEADPLAVGMAEPEMPKAAPLTMDAAEPDAAAGWGDAGPKSFAYAEVAASGQIGYRILSQPDEGRVEDRGDGSFTFEPGPPLLDMAIGEMCQVDFIYQVEIDGQEARRMKATVTVTGTGDGPEADAVFFSPEEASDSLDGAPAAAAPLTMDSNPEISEMPLPVGSADLDSAPETSEAMFEEPSAPLPLGPADLDAAPEASETVFEEPAAALPLGPADDRMEEESVPLAPVGDGELSGEMPPGTEPWPSLDPSTEATLREAHDENLGGSSPFEPPSPVAELAAEHGTDVPDSIPAFLTGEPEAEVADGPTPDDSKPVEESVFGTPVVVGDETPPTEPSEPEEPHFLDDTPMADLSTEEAGDGAAVPAAFMPDNEDIFGTERDGASVATDPAAELPAAPEVFEEIDALEDDAIAAPATEEAVTYFEDTAGDFSSSEQEPGDGDLAPLDALEEAPAEGAGGPIDLAAAYLKAQGADLSPPVPDSPSPAAKENALGPESGPAFAGGEPQVFDDESPFESPSDEALLAAEPAAPAAGHTAPESQSGADLLPGVTAAEVLKSVVGGHEDEAEDDGDEMEDGERSDTLHVDGVNGGPGVGGWDLELTAGDIVETHSEYLLLSNGATGAVVLDGNVGLIKFEGIERIVW